MRAPIILRSFIWILTGVLMGCSDHPSAKPQAAAAPSTEPAVASAASRISGPYVHSNLAVYLIHGQDQLKGVKYLTLGEALEQKKVILHETGSVNELALENVSDESVYIQSGEIVKGGRQDRTLGTDMVVTRSMGKVPISSFCVEQGRWTGREGEASGLFAMSKEMVSGREMKLASNSNSGLADQGQVWAKVSEAQHKLSENAGQSLFAASSPSSFQLTLEQKALTDKTNEYLKDLAPVIDGNDDAIGWAYAINGKIVGGNVYASRELFRKLWPKLIRSGCVEAFAELKKNAPSTQPAPPADAVQAFLNSADKANHTEKEINARTRVVNYDQNDSVLLQTDDSGSDQWIHRNYMTKEAAPARGVVPSQSQSGGRR
jgi:hypothetical protein